MSDRPRIVDYERGLFRVELQPIDGRMEPYIFVRRVGAVTVLPVIRDPSGQALVLTIDNDRRYYGAAALSLPGGNIDGGHDHPEQVADAALRELREETGFGYVDSRVQNITIFALRRISSSIEYPRFFAVVRDVEYVGGEVSGSAEIVRRRPISLEIYVDELLKLKNGRIYPEVNSAFAKAGMECGKDAVLAWLMGDESVRGSGAVARSFEPWLIAT